MSMRMYMHEVHATEKEILKRQFEKSPFYKNPRQVTTIDIFDFDSTLFLSPMLSCNLWHKSFINIITTENLIGPGWWRDRRSLDNIDYNNYWNEDVVNQVKLSMNESSHMTVLLTGRRYHPFHSLINDMLKSKGLVFDLIGLRPDPEQEEVDETGLGFNYEPNIFDTTMEFKICFIINLLNTCKSITEINMWDDRMSHIYVFQNYLNQLKQAKLIEKGQLVCIKPIKPKYNPEWELDTVNKMISTHNEVIQRLDKSLPSIVTLQLNNGKEMTSMDLFKLTLIPSMPTLILNETTVLELKSMFQSIYHQELLSLDINEWESNFAEESMYFGDQILLLPNQLKQRLQTYKFRIIGRTSTCIEFGMILQVKLIDLNTTCILPLWYKPSVFSSLLKKNFDWIPIHSNQVFTATSAHHYFYTVTSHPVKKFIK